MEMFATVEMRWFFPGEIPTEAEDWFEKQVGNPAAQPSRVDYYLRLDDNDSLGIKLREGRVEIKQRERPGELVSLGENAVGLVEAWRKWPFVLAAGEAAGPFQADWIGVWKSRRWVLFEVLGNGCIIPASSSIYRWQGCACELTTVRRIDSSEQWWSLGFEAFGEASSPRDNLFHSARPLLDVAAAPVLPAEYSYSYPAWLQKVAR